MENIELINFIPKFNYPPVAPNYHHFPVRLHQPKTVSNCIVNFIWPIPTSYRIIILHIRKPPNKTNGENQVHSSISQKRCDYYQAESVLLPQPPWISN